MDKIEKDISIAWKRYAHDAGLEINTFEYNVSRQAFIYGYKEGKINSNHKKTFRLSINSDSYCLEDGVGSIENFEKVWQKEVKRFKHRPIGNV